MSARLGLGPGRRKDILAPEKRVWDGGDDSSPRPNASCRERLPKGVEDEFLGRGNGSVLNDHPEQTFVGVHGNIRRLAGINRDVRWRALALRKPPALVEAGERAAL